MHKWFEILTRHRFISTPSWTDFLDPPLDWLTEKVCIRCPMKLPSTGGELPPASTGGEMTTFFLLLLEHLVAIACVLSHYQHQQPKGARDGSLIAFMICI